MARNRLISKQNKRKYKEEVLDFKNDHCVNDEVPYMAVLNIINKRSFRYYDQPRASKI